MPRRSSKEHVPPRHSLKEELDAVNRRLQEKVAELEQAGEEMANLLTSGEIAAILLDRDLCIRRVTQAVTELSSSSEGDIGRPIADIVRTFQDDALLEDARRVLAGLTPASAEVQANDGRWYQRRILPYRTKDERIEGLIVTFNNVTERKAAEAEVQRLAEQRQLALDAAQLGWWQYDPITRIARWDDRYRTIFGVTEHSRRHDEILRQIIHPDDVPGLWAKVEAALNPADPQPYAAEFRINRPDGQTRWIEAHGIVTFKGEGASRRAVNFVGTVADVTERRRTEAEKQRLAATIHQERDQLAALINSITDEIWFADTDKRVTLVNPAVWKEFGAGLEEAKEIEKIAASFEVYRGDGTPRPVVEAPPLRALKGDTITAEEEIVRTPGTGQLRHRQVNAAPVRATDGTIIGSVAVVRDITEQRRAEEALRESEERYRGIVETAEEGIATHRPDGTITYVNQRMANMLGYSREQIIGRLSLDFVDDSEKEAVIQALDSLKDQGSFSKERKLRRKDGSILWTLSNVTPRRDGAGDFLGYLAMHTDITERKAAEQALRESEASLKRAQEIAHLGSWDLDLVTNRLTWSDEIYRIFGLQREEFGATYEAFLERVHPDDRAAVNAAYSGSVRDGRDSYEIEHRVVRKDTGEIRHVHEKCQHVRDVEGRIILSLGMVLDITERKQAEEALRASEERLRFVLDTCRIGAWDMDIADHTVIRSPQHDRVYGYDVMLPEWTYEMFLEHVLPEDRVRVDATYQQAVRTQASWSFEFRIRRPDAQVRWIWATGDHKREADGTVRRVAGIVLDITERKQAEEVLRQHSTVLAGINRVLELGLGGQTEEEFCKSCLEVLEGATASKISFICEIGSDGFLHDLAISNPGRDACKIQDHADQHKTPGNFPMHGIYGRVLSDGKGLIVNDPASDPDRIGLPQGHPPLMNFLGVPLVRQGKTVGTIAVGNRGGGYRMEDQQTLEALAPAIVEALDRKRVQQALRAAKGELEQRVRERTEDLSRTINSLRDEVARRTLAEEALRQRGEQLRSLASALTLAEQRERKRLAQVLHDNLQQLLVGAKYRLSGLSRSSDRAARQAGVEVEDLLDQSIECSRSLTGELSLPILHEAGLVAGLEWLAVWMQQKHGLNVELRTEAAAAPDSEDMTVLLFQAVRELLFNIVKHAGVTTARVDLSKTDDHVEITVDDEGAGFDPRTAMPGKDKAGGFGLFSIGERLTLMGGTMEIDSAPGRGSRLKLRAPHRSAGPVGEQMPTTLAGVRISRAGPLLAGPTSGGAEHKIRVLLVDDHVVVRQGLSHLLREEPDIEIVGEASDGQTGVEMVRRFRPDVVMMDINMPGMDGIQATRVIHAEFPDVRVIGLSMFEEGDRAEAMRSAGAVSYLTKNGPSEALVATIRGCRGQNVRPRPDVS